MGQPYSGTGTNGVRTVGAERLSRLAPGSSPRAGKLASLLLSFLRPLSLLLNTLRRNSNLPDLLRSQQPPNHRSPDTSQVNSNLLQDCGPHSRVSGNRRRDSALGVCGGVADGVVWVL